MELWNTLSAVLINTPLLYTQLFLWLELLEGLCLVKSKAPVVHNSVSSSGQAHLSGNGGESSPTPPHPSQLFLLCESHPQVGYLCTGMKYSKLSRQLLSYHGKQLLIDLPSFMNVSSGFLKAVRDR